MPFSGTRHGVFYIANKLNQWTYIIRRRGRRVKQGNKYFEQYTIRRTGMNNPHHAMTVN